MRSTTCTAARAHPARCTLRSTSRAAAARVTLAAALTTASFAGCSIFSVENDDLEQLRSQRRAWEQLAITDYDMVFEQNCFCAPETLRPVLIQVRADQTVSIVRPGSGESIPASQWETYPNIDQLFQRLEAWFKLEDTRASATYDATWHFPDRVTGSTKGALDSNITYTVTGFSRQ